MARRLFFESIDGLVARYFAGRDQLGAVRALDLRAIRGKVCAACGAQGIVRTIGRTVRGQPEWIDACVQCGASPFVEAEGCDILRGHVDLNPRPGAAEEALAISLDGWRRLRQVVEPRPRDWTRARWEFALQAFRVYLDPRVCGYDHVANLAWERGVEPLDWWTSGSVRHWIGKARRVLEARALQRPRLIPPRRRDGERRRHEDPRGAGGLARRESGSPGLLEGDGAARTE